MSSVSVVLLTHNHWPLCHQALWDLYKNCKESLAEVVIVNDASTDSDYYDGLSWWKKQNLLPIRELRLKEGHHFIKAANKGMAKASGDVLILLSNDVRVFGDICKDIADILDHDPKCLVGGKLLNFDTGWNTFDGKVFPYIEGWLMACTKDAWNEFGGMDVNLAPHDFEDVDLSTTAVSLGYSLIAIDANKTQHIGAQTIGYNPEREALTRRNREKFKEKWIK